MVIESAAVYRVEMPLAAPWRTSVATSTSIETVLVNLHGEGMDAWGEATPHRFPEYCPEWGASTFALLRDVLIPEVIGVDITSGRDLQTALGRFRGVYFAKAALDTAWWSLESRRTGRSVAELVGANHRRVEVGADIGILDRIEDLLAEVGAAVDAGCRRVKIKCRRGWDLEPVRAVRAAFPTLAVHVDCNGAYSLDDVELFQHLDAEGLAMIEQPLAHDDLVDHAALQRRLDTALCLDESICSVRNARHAIDLASCRWINIKPGRVGGLTPAVEIHEMCRDNGIGCWVGAMLESAIGASFCLDLAARDGMSYPSDIFPTERFYARDLAEPSLHIERSADGWFAQVDGVPRVPRLDLLEEWTVEAA